MTLAQHILDVRRARNAAFVAAPLPTVPEAAPFTGQVTICPTKVRQPKRGRPY